MTFAALKHQGLAFPDLYVLQGIWHLNGLLKWSVNSKRIQSQLLRISAEHLKLELGLNGPVFGHNWKVWKNVVSPCWLTNTWEFLNLTNITVQDDISEFALARKGDVLLMQAFFNKGYTPKQLKALNKCRLFLQVLTLSDISSGCGTYILQEALKGIKYKQQKSDWPLQGNPGKENWMFWKTALTECFSLSSQGYLPSPMGAWYHSNNTKWFFSQTETRLYGFQDNGWTFYPRNPARASTRHAMLKFNRNGQIGLPPKDLQHAVVIVHQSHLALQGYSDIIPPESVDRSSFLNFFSKVYPMLEYFHLEIINLPSLIQAISTSTCLAISDGSFKDKFGTAAWHLSAGNETILLSGKTVVPGTSDDHSAFRSELMGLYGISVTLHAICSFAEIRKGSCLMGCDGKNALYQIFNDTAVSGSTSHFDLISATRQVISDIPLTLSHLWVKGHQDNTSQQHFDAPTMLNIAADSSARQFLSEQIILSQPSLQVWKEPWSIWIDGRKVCKQLKISIEEWVHQVNAMKYLSRKDLLGTLPGSAFDWEATSTVMTSLSTPHRQWVSKHITGFCAVGNMMVKRKEWTDPACPRCGKEESKTHILKCQDKRAVSLWEESLQELQAWLDDYPTAPELSLLLISNLRSWLTDQPHPQAPQGLAQLSEAQMNASWEALVEGRPVLGWAQYQQNFLTQLGSKCSGKRWLVAVLKKLLDIAWDLWDQRNGILHKQKGSATHSILRDEIRAQFDLGIYNLPSEVQNFFKPGIDSVLQEHPAQLTALLHRTKGARNLSANSFQAERTLLRNWLSKS